MDQIPAVAVPRAVPIIHIFIHVANQSVLVPGGYNGRTVVCRLIAKVGSITLLNIKVDPLSTTSSLGSLPLTAFD